MGATAPGALSAAARLAAAGALMVLYGLTVPLAQGPGVLSECPLMRDDPGARRERSRIGADSYRPPNASVIRTASSFLTSASGRGWSTGKCSDPLVEV